MHSNFSQFLYTVAAGVLLGAVYVLTDSIWCPLLVHLINNSTSVLQMAVYERFDTSAASVIMTAVDGVILLLGFVSAVYLVLKYGRKTRGESRELKSVFGRLEKGDGTVLGASASMSAADTIQAFLSAPAVVMFIICSALTAIYRLI